MAAGDTVSVCLHAFVSVYLCLWRADGGSGHTCPDREAIETPRLLPTHPSWPPPPPLRSVKGHTWSLTRWNPLWLGESVRSEPAGTMLSGQREEEGGRDWWSERRRGEILYLLSLPSYKLRSRRCHNKPGTNGELISFCLGDVRSWVWRCIDPASEVNGKPQWVQLRLLQEVKERGADFKRGDSHSQGRVFRSWRVKSKSLLRITGHHDCLSWYVRACTHVSETSNWSSNLLVLFLRSFPSP